MFGGGAFGRRLALDGVMRVGPGWVSALQGDEGPELVRSAL